MFWVSQAIWQNRITVTINSFYHASTKKILIGSNWQYVCFPKPRSIIFKTLSKTPDALSLNPTIKQTHLNLGLIAILKGEFIIAESRLRQALALDPDYILAYENLVLSAKKQNKNKDVKFYLNKILEIAPNHQKAIQLLKQLH